MKGIILSGGTGSRMYPATLVTSKQLLPVYNKPMIYYPLSVLMLAGVTDILVITNTEEVPRYKALLKDGSQLGITISYVGQDKPRGIPEAFILGEKFMDGQGSWLIFGDNFFYSDALPDYMKKLVKTSKGAVVFSPHVKDPQRFGVIEFDEKYNPVNIVEKPAEPKSNYIVSGLCYCDKRASQFAKKLKPSARGELEYPELLNMYLKLGQLKVERLGRGQVWLDMGTPEAFNEATEFVRIIENRIGLKVGCLEEISYKLGLISREQITDLGRQMGNSEYGKYLLGLTDQ